MSARRQAAVALLVAAPVVAALGLTFAVAEGPPRSRAVARPAVVTFEMLPSNHIVVEAKVNGKGPFRFIFDLGAPVTLIGNKAAEAAGIVKADAPRSFLFAMRGEAKADAIELGELTAKDIPVIVLDHPAVKALGGALGRPLDGILGYTFFARYKTTIDYQARRMTFEPVDFEVRDLMKELPGRLAGPKVAQHHVLAPRGLWGLAVVDRPDDPDAAGVPITAVVPGSPAAAAGLRPGDILTTLDGRWTTSVVDTYAAAAAAPVGKPVEVVVLRDGKEMTFAVTPVEGI